MRAFLTTLTALWATAWAGETPRVTLIVVGTEAARVETAEDAAPLRAWLTESRAHRMVLFHTVPYPEDHVSPPTRRPW